MNKWLGIAIVLVAVVPVSKTWSHSLGMSFLKLNELAPGQFLVHWLPSDQVQQRGLVVEPRMPEGCDWRPPTLTCPPSFSGGIDFPGLPRHAEVVLQQSPVVGEVRHYVMVNNRVPLRVASEPLSMVSTAERYFVLGVEHIVFGFDHLLFVLGLVLLSGFNRRLIWTITAFTLAHSVTLTLSMLGAVSLPITPVEVLIALSIVFVAREALSRRPTLARRRPWLVALTFGLLHGFGFASALADIGLPANFEAIALLCFNLGVELGQLGVLIGLALICWLWQRRGALRSSQPRALSQSLEASVLCFLLGSVASFWVIERTWLAVV